MITERDLPKIFDKGFEIASNLADPDIFYAVAQKQKKGVYKQVAYDTQQNKVFLETDEKTIPANPDKLTENGVAICRKKSDQELYFVPAIRHGIAMTIEPKMCGEDIYEGSFHTHPSGNQTPSVGDIFASRHNEDKIMCIGTKSSKTECRISCFIPKAEVIDEEIIAMAERLATVYAEWKDDPLEIKMIGPKSELQKELEKKTGRSFGDTQATGSIPVYRAREMNWVADSVLDIFRDHYDIITETREC
jgi:hypothetical protein